MKEEPNDQVDEVANELEEKFFENIRAITTVLKKSGENTEGLEKSVNNLKEIQTRCLLKQDVSCETSKAMEKQIQQTLSKIKKQLDNNQNEITETLENHSNNNSLFMRRNNRFFFS